MSFKVPYNYLPIEFNNKNSKQIFIKWKELISKTDFTLGEYVNKFEKEFARFVGSKYCISTNNGTDALIICLKSLGVGRGDEVITVANSFYATVGAIVACGAKPILVDCDDRFQIDISRIENKVTKKTKVILPVHWGGASPEIEKILKISKKYNLKVVEDACMGIGGKIKGKAPGTFGEISAYSMHPLKSLNVMGDGGMVVTNNKKLFLWTQKYRNHGMRDRDHIDFWGVNMRLQPLQAIVAMHRLKELKRTVKRRNINANILDKELLKLYPNVVIPHRPNKYLETFSLYMCTVKKRDKLVKFLIKNKIEVKIHYPIPLNQQKASKYLKLNQNEFINVNTQAKSLITLPVHQYLTKDQLVFMVEKIKLFYEKKIQ